MYLRRPGRRRLLLHAVVILTICLLSSVEAIWPFQLKRFRGNALISAGSRGLSADGRVVAFGDFNGDQSLDILVLNPDQQTLTVYHWNHDLFTFTPSDSFKHSKKIVNVVPGDFTHSSKLDLLVMSPSDDENLDISIYFSRVGGDFEVNAPLKVASSSLPQPITIDVDGDMKIDLLGVTSASHDKSNAPLQVWKNIWNSSSSTPSLFQIEDAPFSGTPCAINDPHSNAVVDLNGDCLADIFLTCDDGKGGKTYQLWINNKEKGFSLSQQGQLPHGTQAISFADIDRDGTIDMIFPSCNQVDHSTGVGSECFINVAYNQQLGLCSSTTESGFKNGSQVCRRPEDLCVADRNFKFDLTDSPANQAFVRFPVSTILPASSLLVYDVSFTPPLPIPLKLGDADLDGFPDMLAISVQGHDYTPHLLYSIPCRTGLVGCSKSGIGRSWQMATGGTDILDNIKDARSVSFLDMDEDGTLDIMVQRTGLAGEGTILFIQNNFYFDAFFLKAIVLNGACDNGWCYTQNNSIRYHPYGVSYSGATFKYTVLDTAGRRSAASVGQLPQTSYHALQTPYSFFGLGRTNNYIENLFVGTTVQLPEHYINMEGVIPNSKVVIFPSAKEGQMWKEELFLRPGEWIPWVTATVIGGMVILGIIVFVLHLNEKREDELERRRISHHINFDAL